MHESSSAPREITETRLQLSEKRNKKGRKASRPIRTKPFAWMAPVGVPLDFSRSECCNGSTPGSPFGFGAPTFVASSFIATNELAFPAHLVFYPFADIYVATFGEVVLPCARSEIERYFFGEHGQKKSKFKLCCQRSMCHIFKDTSRAYSACESHKLRQRGVWEAGKRRSSALLQHGCLVIVSQRVV